MLVRLLIHVDDEAEDDAVLKRLRTPAGKSNLEWRLVDVIAQMPQSRGRFVSVSMLSVDADADAKL